jgi:hypothetical protein
VERRLSLRGEEVEAEAMRETEAGIKNRMKRIMSTEEEAMRRAIIKGECILLDAADLEEEDLCDTHNLGSLILEGK